jgi:CubicO group peptidase (beta-lactamase class C family)
VTRIAGAAPRASFVRRIVVTSMLLCIGLSLFLPSSPVSAQFPSDSMIRALLQSRVERFQGVGIVVGLFEADATNRVVLAGSAGKDAAPLGAESIFEIGSITKVFTGTLLAGMARKGEISLTEPVQRYLRDDVRMPARGNREITLLDLATHRSGLPRLPTNFRPATRTNPYVDYKAEHMYDFLSSYELERDIGAQFEYSNLGAGLLGHVLTTVAGVSYETLVRERILRPLGMSNTGIDLTNETLSRMTQGHDEQGVPVPSWTWNTSSALAGAGALRSNVGDMLRFLEANLGEPTSELEASMRDTHRAFPATAVKGAEQSDRAAQSSIGLTWLISSAPGELIIWHNGGTGGFRSFIGFAPRRQVGVVVLSNSATSVDDIGFHLLDPTMPLARMTGRWKPGWTVTLLLVGVGLAVLVLEVSAKNRLRRARALT